MLIYTMIIFFLVLLSVTLINTNKQLYFNKRFLFWLIISCLTGWTEFICFLRFDAWVFSSAHILGIKFLGVTIEDYLFCPCFSVIFWKLYFVTKSVFFQRIYNPSDKLTFTILVSWSALIYFDIGSPFAKYMSVRTCLGMIGLIYCWNKTSFRHSILFIGIVYCIGFFWDLPSVACGVWQYVHEGSIPVVYDGILINFLGAVFPIELFGYYFTGGFFSFWFITFVNNYFDDQEIALSGNLRKQRQEYKNETNKQESDETEFTNRYLSD